MPLVQITAHCFKGLENLARASGTISPFNRTAKGLGKFIAEIALLPLHTWDYLPDGLANTRIAGGRGYPYHQVTLDPQTCEHLRYHAERLKIHPAELLDALGTYRLVEPGTGFGVIQSSLAWKKASDARKAALEADTHASQNLLDYTDSLRDRARKAHKEALAARRAATQHKNYCDSLLVTRAYTQEHGGKLTYPEMERLEMLSDEATEAERLAAEAKNLMSRGAKADAFARMLSMPTTQNPTAAEAAAAAAAAIEAAEAARIKDEGDAKIAAQIARNAHYAAVQAAAVDVKVVKSK